MKRYIFYILLLGSILVLSGCSNLSKNEAKKKISIKNQTFNLAVADTLEKQRQGLMNRESMPENEGMLFIFDNKDYQQFWMKNTLIPLQLIVIDRCKIVDLLEMEKEQDPSNPQKIYKSGQLSDKAIELNAKTFTRDIIGQEITSLCE